jgi:hypothetical protein
MPGATSAPTSTADSSGAGDKNQQQNILPEINNLDRKIGCE